MPSQEADMPPTLSYPYSSNEEFSPPRLDSPGLSAEDVIGSSTVQSANGTGFDDQHQGKNLKHCSDPDDQGLVLFADDRFNDPQMKRKFMHHHLQDSSSNPVGGGSGTTVGAYTSVFNNSTSGIHQTPLAQTLNSDLGILVPQDTLESPPEIVPGNPLGLPRTIFARIVSFLDQNSLLNARATARSWLKACVEHRPLRFSSLYRLPVELIQLILTFASPASFNAAKNVCRAWHLSALDPSLLRLQLRTLGFYYADPTIKNSQNTHYLSTRLSREFSLGAGGSNVCGLQKTAIIDLSDLAATTTIHFTVSICGSYALLSEGCVVYVYRLQATTKGRIEFVASVVCPRRVLAVSMDTSSRRFAIAILLDGRMGLVHDVVEQEAKSTYRNLCSDEDPPRSVAICPQRRCVAFGCHGGIELHWVDALTGQDLNRWFPLTAPSDFLYFLPPRRGIDSAKKLRLISSAVHPKEANPLSKRFGASRGSLAFWGSWEPRAGQSDHFQAVPLSDGYHILFMDPETGGLCLGSDAPLGYVSRRLFLSQKILRRRLQKRTWGWYADRGWPGVSGPTKLLRKIWLIPPQNLGKSYEVNEREDIVGPDSVWKAEERDGSSNARPTVYASGADMRFGVRVVAGYSDHVVLFSIPPDVFDGSKREDESQGETAENSQDEEDLSLERAVEASTEKPWKPINVQGCYVGTVSRLIDLAVDSGPNMVVYAFSANGQVVVYQLEKTAATVTAAGDQSKVTRIFSRRNGEIAVETVDDQSEGSCEVWEQVDARLDGEVENNGTSGTDVYLQDLEDIWEDDYDTGHGDGYEYECYDGFRVDCLLDS